MYRVMIYNSDKCFRCTTFRQGCWQTSAKHFLLKALYTSFHCVHLEFRKKPCDLNNLDLKEDHS